MTPVTPKEIYEWAKDNGCEDFDITFQVDVGSDLVELGIDQVWRPTSGFEIIIHLS